MRRIGRLYVCVSIVAALVAPVAVRAAVLPGASGLILVDPQASGGGPLVALNPDTGARSTLLGSVAADAGPHLAPNGTKLSFVNGANVFIADFPSGNNRQQVTTSGGAIVANWSPNSSTLVFECASGICTAPAAPNAPVTLLTGSAAGDITPDYSPDGQFIVFTDGFPAATGVFRLNANGSGGRTKLLGSATGDGRPVVAPNGSVVYFDTNGGGADGINTLSWPNGGNRALLTGTLSTDKVAAPSPDGTKVAFAAGGLGGTTTVNANSTGGRSLVPGSLPATGEFFPSWSSAAALGPVPSANAAPVFSSGSACGGAAMLRVLPLFGPGTATVSASDTAGQTVTLSASGLPGYVSFTSAPGNPATGTLAISANPLEFLNLLGAVVLQTPSSVTITATDNGTPVASATCSTTVRVGIV